MTNASWLARPAAERAADLARIRETVTTLSVRADSPDGDLSVVVGPGGSVTGIDLTARALRRPADELSDVLIDTIRGAARTAHEQLAERLTTITGGRGSTMPAAGHLPPVPSWSAIEESVPGRTPVGGEIGAKLDGLLAGARSQLVRYEALRAALADLSEVGTSADGVASVTVRADGAIQRIAVEGGPERAGAAIVEALRRARAQASRSMAERTQELLGSRVNVRQMVESAIADQLGKVEG
jgi:DNA-binding protein YbaB